ncbi:hypothetical protein HN937_14230 [Candidatus Poribacteria bacterium]|nr:hypothetical protein [Candidatus Poribacteria bacterium]
MHIAREFSVRRILGQSCPLVLCCVLVAGCLAPVAIGPPEERDRQDASASEADRGGKTAVSQGREPPEPQEIRPEEDDIARMKQAMQRELERLGLGPEALTSESRPPFLVRPTPAEVHEYIVERRAALEEVARAAPEVTTAARIFFARDVPATDMGELLDGQGVLAKDMRDIFWTDGTISGGMKFGSDGGDHLAELCLETVTDVLSMATSKAIERAQRRLGDLEKPDSPLRRLTATGHAQQVGEQRALLRVLGQVGLPVHCIIVAHTPHAALARVDGDTRVLLVDLVLGSHADHWAIKEAPAQ